MNVTHVADTVDDPGVPNLWRAQAIGWLFIMLVGLSSRTAVFGSAEAALWLTLAVEPLAFVMTSVAAVLLLRHSPLGRPLHVILPYAVLACAAGAAILACVGYGVHLLLVPTILPEVPQHQFRLGFIYFMGILSIWTLIYFGLSAELAARAARYARMQAETRALRLEIEHLQLQVEPHFLFNCLNTIVAEIQDRPAVAEEMTRRLADYLRFSLDRRGRGLCRLEEEIEAAQAYVRIVALRFDRNFECRCDVEPAALEVELPHMTLQGLVENALKHGMRTEHEGFDIEIRARRKGNEVVIEVENPGKLVMPFDLAEGGGLRNLCRRLELRYPDRHGFSLKQQGEKTLATVRLNGHAVVV